MFLRISQTAGEARFDARFVLLLATTTSSYNTVLQQQHDGNLSFALVFLFGFIVSYVFFTTRAKTWSLPMPRLQIYWLAKLCRLLDVWA